MSTSLENLERKDEQTQVPPENSAMLKARKTILTRRNMLYFLLGSLFLTDRFIRGGYDKISGVLYRILNHGNYKDSLPSLIETLKEIFPEIDQWMDSEEWAQAILEACEKNNLNLADENIGIVLTIIIHESGFRTSARGVQAWATPTERSISSTGLVKPRTSGPMELSNQVIMQQANVPYAEAVKLNSTIKEGLFYGIKHLKTLLDIYSNKKDNPRMVLQSIFADYNAGPFASRNAGLQRALNELQGNTLREDGLLLQPRRQDGKAQSGESQTQKVITELFSKNGIQISPMDIRHDLSLEAGSALERTKTWLAVQTLYKRDIPLVPADRPVLGVVGFFKKAITGIGDSREYSQARMSEFDKIMEVVNRQF